MKSLQISFLCLATFAAPCLRAADDILIADFEEPDYGRWKTTGDAFGPGPARGTLPGQMEVSGFEGKGLVNSFYGGDQSTGTLTSPEFKIERRFISFLIGGGKDPEKTCLNLIIEGKVVRKATGPNDKPGGSEALGPESWDVSEFAGKNAVIQIVDQAKGGWGHINVDHIIQTDRKSPALVENLSRAFKIEKHYLNIPIKNEAPKRVVTVLIDGRVELSYDMELAGAAPDWWAPMDVSAWFGKTVTLKVNQMSEDSTALSSIEQSDSVKGAEDPYREPLRGQFHFSARRGWNNDPNGLVFFNDEYHLFFQHNPYGWNWGNMHWGHAVSKDLVHWKSLEVALHPDANGTIFSGSAVDDRSNTSGLGIRGRAPLVAIFTSHDHALELAGRNDFQNQSLAYSLDKGRTWFKYAGNPVLRNPGRRDFRDPKVSWFEPQRKWVMTLAVGDHVSFYSSKDLKAWNYESDFGREWGAHGGVWECPDLISMMIDGEVYGRVTRERFDAVILDLTLPGGMGGKEALKKLIEIDPTVNAIVSSGYAMDATMSRYQDFGFRGVISKPYEAAELGKTVHDVIASSRIEPTPNYQLEAVG
jgi:CheY-like chemotaxis protein